MTVPSRFIHRFDFSEIRVLDSTDPNKSFLVDRPWALELAERGLVTGRGSRNRLKVLISETPVSELLPASRPHQRATTDLIAEDSRTSFRELPRTYSLSETCAAYAPNFRAYQSLRATLRVRACVTAPAF